MKPDQFKREVAYINLSGDYHIEPHVGASLTGNVSALRELSDFLGILRGAVNDKPDAFTRGINDLVNHTKFKNTSGLVLKITTKLSENELIHEFSITAD